MYFEFKDISSFFLVIRLEVIFCVLRLSGHLSPVYFKTSPPKLLGGI